MSGGEWGGGGVVCPCLHISWSQTMGSLIRSYISYHLSYIYQHHISGYHQFTTNQADIERGPPNTGAWEGGPKLEINKPENLLGKWGKWGKSHLRTTTPPLASGTRLFGKWEFPTLTQTFLPSQHGELTGLNRQSGDSEPVIQNRWFIVVDSEWSVK